MYFLTTQVFHESGCVTFTHMERRVSNLTEGYWSIGILNLPNNVILQKDVSKKIAVQIWSNIERRLETRGNHTQRVS